MIRVACSTLRCFLNWKCYVKFIQLQFLHKGRREGYVHGIRHVITMLRPCFASTVCPKDSGCSPGKHLPILSDSWEGDNSLLIFIILSSTSTFILMSRESLLWPTSWRHLEECLNTSYQSKWESQQNPGLQEQDLYFQSSTIRTSKLLKLFWNCLSRFRETSKASIFSSSSRFQNSQSIKRSKERSQLFYACHAFRSIKEQGKHDLPEIGKIHLQKYGEKAEHAWTWSFTSIFF